MAKKLKSFNVYAKLSVEASIVVRAGSLDEAVAEANNLKETDFIQFVDECVSSDPMEIRGVFATD